MSNDKRTDLPEWKALHEHAKSNPAISSEHLSLATDGLLFDYSKQDITPETKSLLLALAKACDLETQRDALFAGEPVNKTEGRAALHTDLRKPKPPADVKDVLAAMQTLQEDVWKSDITDIVNIGIGGSDIGPHMVCEALKPHAKKNINVRFLSNIDGQHFENTLEGLKPESTLFIVCSKSFTTDETITNARSALKWAGNTDNFVAVTGNRDAALSFGISESHILPLWDWVGGRFSLWGSVGLSICLSLGFDHFKALIDGAHDMDKHFQSQPLENNIPVIAGLLSIWHRNFRDRNAWAVLPYSQSLHLLPTYLQQMEMESNGKNVDLGGNKIDYATAPIVFGQVGTNGQHAFYQFLHQGTDIIPCEFIVVKKPPHSRKEHHKKLNANALGQSQALMQGKTDKDPHKVFDGNRPSTTIVLDELTPRILGMLLAFYEHKIFVEGVIWNINSFDQWGVELGKSLAKDIFDGTLEHTDPSTKSLMDRLK